MAIDSRYITVPDIKKLFSILQSDDDELLSVSIDAMCRVFDRKLGWPAGFKEDAAVTTRLYVGDGSRLLRLNHAIASTTGFEVKIDTDNDGSFADETALTSDDYQMQGQAGDLNPDKGPMARPWVQIYIPTWSTTYGYWPEGHQAQVTALHGWPVKCPEQVRLGVGHCVAMLGGHSIFTTGRIQELDSVVDASPQARAILRDLWQTLNRYPVGVG